MPTTTGGDRQTQGARNPRPVFILGSRKPYTGQYYEVVPARQLHTILASTHTSIEKPRISTGLFSSLVPRVFLFDQGIAPMGSEEREDEESDLNINHGVPPKYN